MSLEKAFNKILLQSDAPSPENCSMEQVLWTAAVRPAICPLARELKIGTVPSEIAPPGRLTD